MISGNAAIHIQLTVRDVAASALLLVLALAGCAPSGDGEFDEDRPRYIVSSQAVRVSDVELTFESCSLPQQCDLILQIHNKSDRCIAFNEVSLPGHDHTFLDTTFSLPRRITGYPSERVRQTFAILQAGDKLRQSVDLHAIYDVADLSSQSVTFTTRFSECTVFTGAPAQSYELVSAPITFTATP